MHGIPGSSQWMDEPEWHRQGQTCRYKWRREDKETIIMSNFHLPVEKHMGPMETTSRWIATSLEFWVLKVYAVNVITFGSSCSLVLLIMKQIYYVWFFISRFEFDNVPSALISFGPWQHIELVGKWASAKTEKKKNNMHLKFYTGN